MTPSRRRRHLLHALGFGLLLGLFPAAAQTPPQAPPGGAPAAPGTPGAQTPPGETGEPEKQDGEALVPPATDPGETPSGALAFFMASRDYRTIRELKSILTPQAKAAYDHDSVAYNGRKGVRLAAWDYREPAPKPGATSVSAGIRSLWEDQGEAVEQRSETARLQRDPTGPWRVGSLQKTGTENLRMKDAVPGVTTLRMLLRAWRQRDLPAARSLFTDSFLKKVEAKGDGLAGLFTPPEGKRHAAFRIQSLDPSGTTGAVAKVSLVDVVSGRPGPLDGTPRTLTLVKRGSRWLVDDWR
ncbi:MAG TPA: nuclear transport factor 2 family protein [Candidatus Polarisedimenticolia bacterium]|nr:nuclear transport factor 2 family protein [Candidatus Polarisedimenticolia bacterium]